MLNKYNELLKITQYEYPSLYNESILIEKDNKFYVESDILLDAHIIHIGNLEITDKHTNWINNYLKEEYDLDANKHMYYNFNDVFAFLHEVGHIYYGHKNYNSKELYQNYKQKEYSSHKEAWKEYRQIPDEKEADEFAVNIMKNNIYKIWSIMNDITEEQAKEECEFWNI